MEATQAVLFDNDGVLLDTEALFFESTRSAFRRLGLDLTPQIWGTRYLAEDMPIRLLAKAATPAAPMMHKTCTSHVRDTHWLNRFSIKPGRVLYLSRTWLVQGAGKGNPRARPPTFRAWQATG